MYSYSESKSCQRIYTASMARLSSAAVVEWSATGSYTWPVISGVYVTQLRPMYLIREWDAVRVLLRPRRTAIWPSVMYSYSESMSCQRIYCRGKTNGASQPRGLASHNAPLTLLRHKGGWGIPLDVGLSLPPPSMSL